MLRPILKRVLTAISVVPLMGVAINALSYYDPVTDLTWRDMSDATVPTLRGYSWNQIATVCPQDGITPCTDNASSGLTGFTGWVWGTQAQVNTLFGNVFGALWPANGNLLEFSASPLTWGPMAILDFGQTNDASIPDVKDVIGTMGWTSTVWGENPGAAYYAFVIACEGLGNSRECVQGTEPDTLQWAVSVAATGKASNTPWLGVFLFQPTSQVPEPATLALVALGLAGLGFSRRKR